MSTVKFNVAQATGSYETENGKKTSYINLGVVFENGDGHLNMKLNALPLPNEKGEVWINLFPMKNGTKVPAKKARSTKK